MQLSLASARCSEPALAMLALRPLTAGDGRRCAIRSPLEATDGTDRS